MKKITLSLLWFLAILASLLSTSVSAADRNGWGIVYNISDCGYPNVRSYAFGGDGPGSSCGYWLAEPDLKIIWYNSQRNGNNHNWTLAEVEPDFGVFCKVATQVGVGVAAATLGPVAEAGSEGLGEFLSETFCH